MITGFNTDIIYEGVTYHVQTEDKGLATPLILSLVYDGGTILASKRSPYNDLIEQEFDDKVLAERLQRQHKLICAAIKGGRIEDLKRMTTRDPGSSGTASDAIPEPPNEPPLSILNQIGYETLKVPNFSSKELDEHLEALRADVPLAKSISKASSKPKRKVKEVRDSKVGGVLIKPPALEEVKETFVTLKSSDQNIHDGIDPFELETKRIPKPSFGLPFELSSVAAKDGIFAEQAVAIVSGNMGRSSNSSGKMRIKLLDKKEFVGGDRQTLNISVFKGSSDVGLIDAHVIIKILGSSFRPMIFHAKTGSDGIAVVHLQFPSFKTGRAVLLIRALFNTEENEVRHSISQGGSPSDW